jgi:hypothetical protein
LTAGWSVSQALAAKQVHSVIRMLLRGLNADEEKLRRALRERDRAHAENLFQRLRLRCSKAVDDNIVRSVARVYAPVMTGADMADAACVDPSEQPMAHALMGFIEDLALSQLDRLASVLVEPSADWVEAKVWACLQGRAYLYNPKHDAPLQQGHPEIADCGYQPRPDATGVRFVPVGSAKLGWIGDDADAPPQTFDPEDGEPLPPPLEQRLFDQKVLLRLLTEEARRDKIAFPYDEQTFPGRLLDLKLVEPDSAGRATCGLADHVGM